MELSLEHPSDFLFVRRADAHAILTIEGTFSTSVILTRERAIENWGVTDVASLEPTHITPILDLKPDAVLLGTGAHQQFPQQAVLAEFLRHNVGVEVMDNAAAARTWDILAGEGRNVVAAFILF